MTLPDVCPRDGVSQCKKKACHLYIVEWRTGDEQCAIGYRSTHKQLSKSMPLEDTYAERTRIRLGHDARQPEKGREQIVGTLERKHLQRPVSDPGSVAKVSGEEPVSPVRHEEVVVNNKDTTVFEARYIDESKAKENKKRKSLDEMMDLDLPENYEEEFWK